MERGYAYFKLFIKLHVYFFLSSSTCSGLSGVKIAAPSPADTTALQESRRTRSIFRITARLLTNKTLFTPYAWNLFVFDK